MWRITMYDTRRKQQRTVKSNAKTRSEAESLARVLELIYANRRVLSGVSDGLSLTIDVMDGDRAEKPVSGDKDVTFEEALLWVLQS